LQRAPGRIPNFSLYGETPLPAAQVEPVHIEHIQSRSRKYLWKIGVHRHSSLSQCLLVTAGPVDAVLDGTRASLSGPVVVVIPAGTVHSFKFRADTEGHVLTVALAQLLAPSMPGHRVPIESLYRAPRVLDLRGDRALAARLTQYFELLAHEFAAAAASQAPLCAWLAAAALWTVAAHAMPAASQDAALALDAERLKGLRDSIESNYLKHWPTKRYARRLGLSETSLNRLCRRLVGCTVFDLIQQRVALEARRRLVYGAGPIGRIAADLGFKDPAYFSRFFRRQSGVSPHEFRRQHHGG
jgi:AraC family transcriptional activator of pobA